MICALCKPKNLSFSECLITFARRQGYKNTIEEKMIELNNKEK